MAISTFLQFLMIVHILLGVFVSNPNMKHNKSFLSFLTWFLTQFKVVIKGVRSDNAKELSMVDFYKVKGVVHYLSCVERPKQNFVVERNISTY